MGNTQEAACISASAISYFILLLANHLHLETEQSYAMVKEGL